MHVTRRRSLLLVLALLLALPAGWVLVGIRDDGAEISRTTLESTQPSSEARAADPRDASLPGAEPAGHWKRDPDWKHDALSSGRDFLHGGRPHDGHPPDGHHPDTVVMGTWRRASNGSIRAREARGLGHPGTIEELLLADLNGFGAGDGENTLAPIPMLGSRGFGMGSWSVKPLYAADPALGSTDTTFGASMPGVSSALGGSAGSDTANVQPVARRSPTPISEPSILGLLGIGLTALAAVGLVPYGSAAARRQVASSAARD